MSSAKKPNKTAKRMTLIFPERTAQRLDRLQTLTDASSATEVLRNALLVYEVVAEAAARGSKLMERTQDGGLALLPLTLDVEICEGEPDEGEVRQLNEPDLKSHAA